MRARTLALVTALATLGVAAPACVDLFHGTSFESACDLDAAACETPDAFVRPDSSPVQTPDAAPLGPTDFCQWDALTAKTAAHHACAWLGACEGAFGDNALAPCILHAELAYDCEVNPNRQVIGAVHAYWDCLSKANSCSAVRACITPSGTAEQCAQDDAGYVGCDTATGTLVACAAGAANGSPATGLEACSALGQTCAVGDTTTCAGSSNGCPPASSPFCDGSGDGRLHDCDPDGGIIDDAGVLDLGVDCTSFGAGSCAHGACLATNDDGTTCGPTSVVTCEGNDALGCPSGVPEHVDCNALLGLPSGTPACDPNAAGRSWDVSRACSAGACLVGDTCTNGVIATCLRGATTSVSVDCVGEEGFSGCTLVSWPGDSVQHAQCTP